jgi:hypothetical protein
MSIGLRKGRKLSPKSITQTCETSICMRYRPSVPTSLFLQTRLEWTGALGGKRLRQVKQDGVVHFQVYEGSTDTEIFENFIEELLPYCGPWPARASVLIMDNASLHRYAMM